MIKPFDAVLLVAFGGPQGPDEVRPFLENVLRGRRVSPGRIEEVAHHYDLFGGVSPLTALTLAQARALEDALRARDLPLPVHVGMRNWHPFLADTMKEMSRAGVRRAIGVLAAAQRSYSGCTQYRENVRDAQAALVESGARPIDVTCVGDWHDHPGFVEANADHVRQAIERLPADRRDRARLVFTAHSIPVAMAERYPYQAQLHAAAERIAHAAGRTDWALVYQSRSGRPGDPWLEPDVCDYLRAEAATGLDTVVLCPVGFLCDHVEVLYDLDVEAADTCREAGIRVERAAAVNTHPRFIDALADAVQDVWAKYSAAARSRSSLPPKRRTEVGDRRSGIGDQGVGAISNAGVEFVAAHTSWLQLMRGIDAANFRRSSQRTPARSPIPATPISAPPDPDLRSPTSDLRSGS